MKKIDRRDVIKTALLTAFAGLTLEEQERVLQAPQPPKRRNLVKLSTLEPGYKGKAYFDVTTANVYHRRNGEWIEVKPGARIH